MKLHPESYIQSLQDLYKIIDERIEQHYRLQPNKALTQPCKKGCSYCCSQFFEVSEGEAMYILSYIEGLTSEQKAYYKELISRTYELFIREYPEFHKKYFADSQNEVFDEESYFDDETRFDIHLPCPFLHSEGYCSIYAFRPLVCRTTGSAYTTDEDLAEVCELIPSSIKAQAWQADLTDLEESIWNAGELSTLNTSEEIIALRQYPLFYHMYELFCTSKEEASIFSNPLYRSYFEEPRVLLEQELYKKLILE